MHVNTMLVSASVQIRCGSKKEVGQVIWSLSDVNTMLVSASVQIRCGSKKEVGQVIWSLSEEKIVFFDNREQRGSRSVTSNMKCYRFRAAGISARIISLWPLPRTHQKLNLRHDSHAWPLFRVHSQCDICDCDLFLDCIGAGDVPIAQYEHSLSPVQYIGRDTKTRQSQSHGLNEP